MRQTVVRIAIVLLLLMVLAVLVPSSTPISIGNFRTLGPFRVSGYALVIAAGALLAVLASIVLGKRCKSRLNTVMEAFISGAIGALLGARILYCAVMIQSILVDYGLAFILRLWEGGYTLFGGVAGGIAGVALYARITKQSLPAMLDVLVPGSALFLMAARLGEYYTAQGLGYYVFDKGLQWFPLAVQDSYGYWMAPVYVYEAFAALVIAVVCMALLLRGKHGKAAIWFLALLSLSQILLDSWRKDEFLRFGFVHVNQLAAVAALGMLLAMSVARKVKQGGLTAWQAVRSTAYVVLTGVLIWIEFALDKSSIDNIILYCIMTAALILMGIIVLYGGKPRLREGETTGIR